MATEQTGIGLRSDDIIASPEPSHHHHHHHLRRVSVARFTRTFPEELSVVVVDRWWRRQPFASSALCCFQMAGFQMAGDDGDLAVAAVIGDDINGWLNDEYSGYPGIPGPDGILLPQRAPPCVIKGPEYPEAVQVTPHSWGGHVWDKSSTRYNKEPIKFKVRSTEPCNFRWSISRFNDQMCPPWEEMKAGASHLDFESGAEATVDFGKSKTQSKLLIESIWLQDTQGRRVERFRLVFELQSLDSLEPCWVESCELYANRRGIPPPSVPSSSIAHSTTADSTGAAPASAIVAAVTACATAVALSSANGLALASDTGPAADGATAVALQCAFAPARTVPVPVQATAVVPPPRSANGTSSTAGSSAAIRDVRLDGHPLAALLRCVIAYDATNVPSAVPICIRTLMWQVPDAK